MNPPTQTTWPIIANERRTRLSNGIGYAPAGVMVSDPDLTTAGHPPATSPVLEVARDLR